MVLPTQAVTLTDEFEVLNAADMPTKTYHLDFKMESVAEK